MTSAFVALGIGTVLAVGALAYVLYPIFFTVPQRSTAPALPSTTSASWTDDVAIAALREIEFDRATGKLSDADYAELKRRYTERAITAMRREEGATVAATPDDEIEAAVLAWRARQPVCATCGPRPEPDAIFCSSCGGYLRGACAQCGAAVDQSGARYCASCGNGLAA